MAHAKSISVDKLAEMAQSSAQKIIGERIQKLGAEAKIGFFPDIGIFGIIIRDFDFDAMPAGEMLKLSTQIAGSLRLDADLEPAIGFTRQFGTMGFFPPFPIDVRDF